MQASSTGIGWPEESTGRPPGAESSSSSLILNTVDRLTSIFVKGYAVELRGTSLVREKPTGRMTCGREGGGGRLPGTYRGDPALSLSGCDAELAPRTRIIGS